MWAIHDKMKVICKSLVTLLDIACYNGSDVYLYRETLKMLDKRKWKTEDEKIHFESGVRMGVGIFNLVSVPGISPTLSIV